MMTGRTLALFGAVTAVLCAGAADDDATTTSSIALSPLPAATVRPLGKTQTRHPASVASRKVSDVSAGALKGAAFSIDFARPADLRQLAVLRVGWNDWAIPRRVSVGVNGDAEREFALVSPRVSPSTKAKLFRADVLDLADASSVTSLTVRVLEVEKKGGPQGALKLFLAAGPAVTCRVDDARTAAGVRVTVTASAPVAHAELSVGVWRFRKKIRFRRHLPPLAAGRNAFEVRWSEFVCAEDPAVSLNPANAGEIELKADAPGVDLELRAEPLAGGGAASSPLLGLQACDASADARGWRQAIPPDGFGRFGWQEDGNGLLTCTLDEKSFFCTARGKDNYMRWCFGNGGAQHRVWRRSEANSVALFTERLMRFEGEEGKQVTSKAFGVFDASRLPERRIAGIMAPGFILDSHDRVFTLAPEMDRGELHLLMPAASGPLWAPGGEVDLSSLSEGWVVLACGGKPSIPVVLAFERHPVKAVREGRGYGFVFEGERGKIGVAPAGGFEGWTGTPGGKDAATETLAANARRLATILRNYPIRCDMRFKVEGDEIVFEERPAFLRWRNDWGESGVPQVPCPPLLSLAHDLGYPVRFPDGDPVKSAPDTRFGPYRTWSADKVPAARYALAKGFKDMTLYPRPTGSAQADHVAEAMLKKLEERKGGGGERDSLSGWFMFGSVATAQTLLSEPQRDRFAALWRPCATAITDDRLWHVRREPFSGREYPISFAWEDRALRILGDANSGIGAALSGLDGYARLTGDWAFIRARWERIRRIPLYCLYGHDWTMMQAGAREHTAGSAIDMDVITYEGTAALARMAAAVGDRDVAAQAEMLLARYAVSYVCKFSAGGWTTPEIPRREWRQYGIGLNEQFGFDQMGPGHGGPNLVNSEIALNLAWIGHFPEVFRLAVERGGRELWRDFEYSFVEHVLTDWRKRHPGRRNCHHANITPHLEMRLMLGESREKIAEELKGQRLFNPDPYAAAECAGFYAYWLGGLSPVRLEDCAPAKVVSFVWDEAAGKVRAELESDEPFRPRFTVIGTPKSAPSLDRTLPKGRTVLEWRF